MTGFNSDWGSALFSRQQPGGVFSIVNPREFSGRIFFVDSNNGTDQAGSGRSPADPVATIDYAIGLCTANEGDVILVAPGHTETLTAKIDVDKAGISIIGLGVGTQRPQITINANIDGIDVTVANVLIRGLYFNEATNARTAAINIAAADAIVEDCHFDLGANDLVTITLTAAAERCTLRRITNDVTANGPDSLVKIEGVVDGFLFEDSRIVGSDGSDAFDVGVIDYNSQAVENPVVRNCHFLGEDVATTVIANAGSVAGECTGPNTYAGSATEADNLTTGESSIGAVNDTTTDSLHGKTGTDTEMADRSLYDILNGGGPAAAATAAAPANDISLYAALRAVFNLLSPAVATGEADIDVSEADYTSYQALLTITPGAGAPCADVRVVFDLDKTTTGWADVGTTETLKLAVARKVDGTNWVRDDDGATGAIVANNADGDSLELVIGDIGVTEEARIEVILSAEATDVELPYAVTYKALSAPTITAVAAA